MTGSTTPCHGLQKRRHGRYFLASSYRYALRLFIPGRADCVQESLQATQRQVAFRSTTDVS